MPFLRRIKQAYGIPLALVHDMGKGILKAVATVFPGVPDFICHFHFLRDIGKDFLGTEYDTIRKRLSKHGISAKLRYRAKQLKADLDRHPELIEVLQCGIENALLPAEARQFMPVLNVYALIQWTLRGKSEGHGYGFPFDRPHLAFARESTTSIAKWKSSRPFNCAASGRTTSHTSRYTWTWRRSSRTGRFGRRFQKSKKRSPSLRSCEKPCGLLQHLAGMASMTRDRRATSAPSKNV